MQNVFVKWVGSGFLSEKGRDVGINGKKWAGKRDLRSLLGTFLIVSWRSKISDPTVHMEKSGTDDEFVSSVRIN